MVTHITRTQSPAGTRAGFTLIEMMVSVALVLLMMSMFAEVFQIFGSTVSKQRGIAENDQRARSVQTVLKADLDKRTFRSVLPFAFAEDTAAVEANMSQRRGYFYISENDPNNDLDDKISFTIQSSITIKNIDETVYSGKATVLSSADPSTSAGQNQLKYELSQDFGNANQPDADDGSQYPDGTTTSTSAEVVWFVRNGNLYRRTVLLREPIGSGGSDVQPRDRQNRDFFLPGSGSTDRAGNIVNYPTGMFGANHVFWNDFDSSACLTYNNNTANPLFNISFSGTSSLDNSLGGGSLVELLPLGSGVYVPSGALSLAVPFRRFGHSHITGKPVEFIQVDGGGRQFLGAYTHEETSSTLFNYPRQLTANTATAGYNDHPMYGAFGDDNNFTDTNQDGVWDQIRNQSPAPQRRAEDLIVMNVHSFNIQVWDEAYVSYGPDGQPGVAGVDDDGANGVDDGGEAGWPGSDDSVGAFVNIGHANSTGDFRLSEANPANYANNNTSGYGGPTETNYGNPEYGPGGPYGNRVFDTWHPEARITGPDDGDADTTIETHIHPPYRPLVRRPLRWDDADPSQNLSFSDEWEPNTLVNVGDIKFPMYVKRAKTFDITLKYGDVHVMPFGAPFYYRCVGTISGAASAATTADPDPKNWPVWPRTDGVKVEDRNALGDGPIWQAVKNVKPLKAIKIEIRFQDPGTKQMRQITMIQSLVD